MTLALSAPLVDAFESGTVYPRYIVEIFVAASTSHKFLSGICDNFVYPESVLTVSSVERSIDPIAKTSAVSTVTVKLLNDSLVSSLVTDYGLYNTQVIITLGDKRIDEVDFSSYYAGRVESVTTSETELILKVKIIDSYLRRRTFLGGWVNEHPFERIIKFLAGAGLNTDFYDPVTLAWDNDLTFSHYVCDAGPPCLDEDDAEYKTATPYRDIIDKLAQLLPGDLITQEDGKLYFVKFDASTADDDWNENDLDEFQPQDIYDGIVNKAFIRSHAQIKKEDCRVGYTHEDTDSQDRYAWNTTGVAYPLKAELLLELTHVNGYSAMNPFGSGLSAGAGAGATFLVTAGRIEAICGTRDPDYRVTPQDVNAKVSASRPAYFLVNEELISVDLITLEGDYFEAKVSTDIALGTGTERKTSINFPIAAECRILSRAALGIGAAVDHPAGTRIYDVTIPVAVGQSRITRYPNGATKINVRTKLTKYALQLGDIVTLTVDENRFRRFGLAGLDTTTKWQIVSKKVDMYASAPGINWVLMFAAEGTPPSSVDSRDGFNVGLEDTSREQRISVAGADTNEPAIISGFDITTSPSNLDVTIDPGAATAFGQRRRLVNPQTITLTASMDSWLSYDVAQNALTVKEQAVSPVPPTRAIGEARLWRITTDGSGVTNEVDIRQYIAIQTSTVIAENMDKSIIANKSINLNGQFNAWTRG